MKKCEKEYEIGVVYTKPLYKCEELSTNINISTDLTNEYLKFLETGEFSDTEILVGKEPNTKIFRLHSLILKMRSPYFRTTLLNDWTNDIIKFQKQNISIEVFDIIIR